MLAHQLILPHLREPREGRKDVREEGPPPNVEARDRTPVHDQHLFHVAGGDEAHVEVDDEVGEEERACAVRNK